MQMANIVDQNQNDIVQLTTSVQKATRQTQSIAAAHDAELLSLRNELELARESEHRATELAEKLLAQAGDVHHDGDCRRPTVAGGRSTTGPSNLRGMLAARSEEVLVQGRIIATLREERVAAVTATREECLRQANAEMAALTTKHAAQLLQNQRSHEANVESLEITIETLQVDVKAIVAELQHEARREPPSSQEAETDGLDRHIQRLIALSTRSTMVGEAPTTEATGSAALMMAVRDSIAQLKTKAETEATPLEKSAWKVAGLAERIEPGQDVADSAAGVSPPCEQSTAETNVSTPAQRDGVLVNLLFAEIAQQEEFIRACTSDHWEAISEIERSVVALISAVRHEENGKPVVRATQSHQARQRGELCARAGDVFQLQERVSVADEEWWLVARVDDEPGALVGPGSSGLIPAHKLRIEAEGDRGLRQCVQVRHELGRYAKLLAVGPTTSKFHQVRASPLSPRHAVRVETCCCDLHEVTLVAWACAPLQVKRSIASVLIKLNQGRGARSTSTAWEGYFEAGWADTLLDMQDIERGVNDVLCAADTMHRCVTSTLSHGQPVVPTSLAALNSTLERTAAAFATVGGSGVGSDSRLEQIAELTKDYVGLLGDNDALRKELQVEQGHVQHGAPPPLTPPQTPQSHTSRTDGHQRGSEALSTHETREIMERRAAELGGLPPGWEASIDRVSGTTFFVNHHTQSTTWLDPRTLYPTGPTQRGCDLGGQLEPWTRPASNPSNEQRYTSRRTSDLDVHHPTWLS
jgi:hypothetical protein